MEKHYLFIVVLFFLCNNLNAQFQWQALNGPEGAVVNQIGVDLFGNYYIKVLGQKHLFRSVDEGKTWESFDKGIYSTRCLKVKEFLSAPDSSLYMLTQDDVYILRPHSEVWHKAKININHWDDFNDISINPDGHLYIGGFKAIYRSTDNGENFDKIINKGGHQVFLSTNGNNNNFVVLSRGASYSLYSFDDDGSNFKKINISNLWIFGLLYDSTSQKLFMYTFKGLYVSDNKGQTWEKIHIADHYHPDLMVMSPEGIIYSLSSREIYTSSDHGVSWTKIQSNDHLDKLNYRTVLFVDDKLLIFLKRSWYFNDFQVALTNKDFSTLEKIKINIKQPDIVHISKDLNGTMYAKTYPNSFLKSNDDWVTWDTIKLNNNQNILELTHNKNGNLFAISSNNKVYKSTDSGITWTDISPQNNYIFGFNNIAISPEGKLFLSGDFELYISSDAGETWEKVQDYSFFDRNNFYFHPSGDIYLTGFSEFAISRDGGYHWEPCLKENQFFDIYFFHIAKNGNIFIAGERLDTLTGFEVGFWKLEEDTLIKIDLPDDSYRSINSIESNIAGDIFIAKNDKIYKSSGNGINWIDITGNLNVQSIKGLYIDYDHYIYALPDYDVIYKSIAPTVYNHFVLGEAFYDENNDCLKDVEENSLPNWSISCDGNVKYMKNTDNSGNYLLNLPNGKYTINAEIPDTNLWQACQNDIELIFNGNNVDTTYVIFPMQAKIKCPKLNISSSVSMLRRCFPNKYFVNYCNKGTDTAKNVFVKIELDSFLIFENASIPVYSQDGNVLQFEVGDLGLGECGGFNFTAKVSCEAQIGQTHCINSEIQVRNPINECSTSAFASDSICIENIGSWDPNEKSAFVNGRQVKEGIKQNQRIKYHIRFQNTGTDTAFNVLVVDKISPFLDIKSITIENSSHPFNWEIKNGNELNFYFQNIMLPDSNINEMQSHGFIDFSISQRRNLLYDTKIANTASIYFDYNPAVLTNEVALVVSKPLITTDPKLSCQVKVIPQPFKDLTHILISDTVIKENSIFEVYDILGKKVFSKPVNSNEIDFYRNNLTNGLYFFTVQYKGKIEATGKLLMQ